jgi:hypothetical protein
VKLAVVCLAEIFDEVSRPHLAISTFGIQLWIESESLALADLHQIFTQFQFFKFIIVGNAGKFQAIDLFILPEQGIVGRTEHRIPGNSAPMPPATMRVPHGHIVV